MNFRCFVYSFIYWSVGSIALKLASYNVRVYRKNYVVNPPIKTELVISIKTSE